jgi:hypothetical protein
MRKILVSIAIVLVCTVVAPAAPLCTTVTGQNVLLGNFSCELGGLTFSNFSAVNAGGVPNPVVTLVTASDFAGGTAYLNFNPNLIAVSGPADLWFYFKITGGLIGIDLSNAGGGSTSIQERVCTVGIGADNLCAQGGVQLANVTANSGEMKDVYFDAVGEAFVWKDILATQPDGHISSFTQSFHIPEPVTFVLIGSGLLALGLVRRRTNNS